MSRALSGSRLLRALGASIVLLWAGVLPVAASILIAEPGGPDQEIYNEGRSLIFDEAWARARTVFENLLKRYPDSPFVDDALYWTAFSLYEEGNAGQGYQTLRMLVTRFPESPWSDDARTLMVRCAEKALKGLDTEGGTRVAGVGSASEYRRFIEESTRDRSSQVSLMAIDTLLDQEPQKAPDLLSRVGSGGSQEGKVVLLDRFFGREMVKVSFNEPAAGFSEGNVTVLVREGDQALQLTLTEALDAAAGRGARRFSEVVRREIRERILEAERSLVTQGAVKDAPDPGRGRAATIVRVVDGEAHYYSNGAETVRILVLRRSAGFSPENIQIFVDGAGGMRHVALEDITGQQLGTTAQALSTDAVFYLQQTLGVIRLDLTNPSK